MANKDLKAFYDGVYLKGEDTHYTKLLLSSQKMTPEKDAILSEIQWKGKRVLDIGCGTGELSYYISKRGVKKVTGIDYSDVAIRIAKQNYTGKNLEYKCEDIGNISGTFDVIIIVGVLEHIDDPFKFLKDVKKMLSPKGSIIVTCPNWSNARGYILLVLKELFGAKITLADIHYLTPIEFIDWSKKIGMKLNWKTIEQSWGHGQKMITDFEKRLPNIAKDFKSFMKPEQVSRFIGWLKTHVPQLETDQKFSGAVGFYHMKK
ncbi:methyltransferase domain-containing protein [Candidatus Parcubacteria bacterium]|nr:methyltransferase domain-containing protein [Candidatus Parcubacteria bacterium]